MTDPDEKPEVVLSTYSRRLKKAHKMLEKPIAENAMTQHDVAEYRDRVQNQRMEDAKIEGALTQYDIADYLDRLERMAQEALSDPVLRSETKEAYQESAADILEDISSKGQLSGDDLQEYKQELEEKTEELDTPDLQKREEVTQEIADIVVGAAAHSNSLAEAKDQQEKDEAIFSELIAKGTVPIGFDDDCPTVSISDFFTFPFGDHNELGEDDWFQDHLQYLDLATDRGKFEKKDCLLLINNLTFFKKIKYKKYFKIFDRDVLDESVFFAVFSLWQNDAFENLKLSE